MKQKMRSKSIVIGLAALVICAVFGAAWFLLNNNTSVEEKVEKTLQGMTLHEKICQLLVVSPESLDVVDVTEQSKLLKENLKEFPVGGFLFKGRNMVSKKQVSKLLSDLQKTSEIPLFMASDEEGGTVARLMKSVGTTHIGSMFDYKDEGTDTAYQNAYTIATDMSSLGFNLDFAPVADVWSNPENTVISVRAYSDDYQQAAELVAAAVEGFHAGNVATTLKHFPGHGDTAQDSHYSSAYVTKSLEELRGEEFLPFAAGINAGSDLVMLGHLIVPELGDEPVLFSYEAVTEILRKELGFEGIIITDALEMGAVTEHYSVEEIAVRAVNAGVDMLLCPTDLTRTVAALEAAVYSGSISEERIDESVRRILYCKYKYE